MRSLDKLGMTGGGGRPSVILSGAERSEAQSKDLMLAHC